MKILLQKKTVMAGLCGKIRPDSMKKYNISSSGQVLKILIRYTSNSNEVNIKAKKNLELHTNPRDAVLKR